MNKKTTTIVYVLCGILLVAVIAAAVLIVNSRNAHEDTLDALDSLDDERDQLNEQLQELSSGSALTIDELKAAKASLEAEVASLKSQMADLEAKMSDAGQTFADEIASLKAAIAARDSEIASLEADIARYETVYTIDVREQARLIDELVTYIETACPVVRRVKDPPLDEDGEPIETTAEEIEYEWVYVADIEEEARTAFEEARDAETSADTNPDELPQYEEGSATRALLEAGEIFYPNISVYYEDLTTGYSFSYEADKVYNSASVIKAPYVLSMLEVISEDEEKYLASLEAEEKEPEEIDTDGDGTPDTIKIEYSDPAFDLSETVIYDSKKMMKEGSGKIKEMEDGVEFSYLDFVKYALEYSDNIAYNQLRQRFGFNYMYSLARRVGANSVLRNANNMTARDAGKLFKAIYEFTEEDEKYGAIMAESMKKGNHTVIIPYGVSPTKTLHKYGWDTDSYHDAAIVLYSDKPYVLTVFTDLDCGGNEVNAYLQNIVRKVNSLHKGFYKGSK
ncbi:MAG: serine hydrolase [Clostridia bacterium]|nr:serine hydrolase [Clostridia bacterium]